MDSISASCINLYDEWIHFSSMDGIYKIHISGRTRTKLSNIPAKYMVLAGGRLFIIDKFGVFHCMNESGEEIKDTGLQKPSHLNIANDRIYYANTKQEYKPYVGSYCTFTYLYETDLNFKCISSMVLAYIDITSQKSPIIVSDGYVYHIELGSLLRSEKNKDNSTLNLQKSVENNFIVSDGWIYFGKYHNKEDNKSEGFGTLVKHMLLDDLHVSDGLYRMRTDGTCPTKMSPDDWCYKNEICLIGNYIYSKKGSSFNHLKKININTTCPIE
jgi:hypothetical protein